MIEIEKKIALQKKDSNHINVDEFMRKLNDKIEASKTNRQIFFTSSAMVFIILLLIVTQFGAPDFELDNYMLSRTENLIETDFWKKFLLNLIKNHYQETHSKIAKDILDNFDYELNFFYQVCPKEMLDKLKNPISNKKFIFKAS